MPYRRPSVGWLMTSTWLSSKRFRAKNPVCVADRVYLCLRGNPLKVGSLPDISGVVYTHITKERRRIPGCRPARIRLRALFFI